MIYTPKPMDTDQIHLDDEILELCEMLAKKVVSLPDRGRFEPHCVTIPYPGTDCNGRLLYEYDLVDSTQRSRRLLSGRCQTDPQTTIGRKHDGLQ